MLLTTYIIKYAKTLLFKKYYKLRVKTQRKTNIFSYVYKLEYKVIKYLFIN